MSLHIVILAAGQGTRMRSNTPKVLHEVAGMPMLERVIDTARALKPEGIHVVIGHGGEVIQQALYALPVNWVIQKEQLGTGHAVMQALPHIPPTSLVLVLSGDVPLITLETLQALIDKCMPHSGHGAPLGLLVASVGDASGLGRIVRNAAGQVDAIVEEKDATAAQRNINEIYSGICCTDASHLIRWLPTLKTNNAQGEYYLTHIVALAVSEKCPIVSLSSENPIEIQGVNNRLQLNQLERAWQLNRAERLMLQGVTLFDASRIDIRGELCCGMDVVIDVNNVFTGHVVIGDGSRIGANCSLKNVILGKHSEIHPNSVLEDCQIGDDCHVGPFARLRPGTTLASGCKIGNFVETKKAVFGANSKASHLSYLGDVTLGKNVNIGAGTITCNYDGVNKHETVIADGVFIGSDTQLIAPVRIGENATIGAGSTIYKDVPPGELTLTEAIQKTVLGWVRPRKKTK